MTETDLDRLLELESKPNSEWDIELTEAEETEKKSLYEKLKKAEEDSKKFNEMKEVFHEDSPFELAILHQTLKQFKEHSRCGICGMVTPEKQIDNHIELHENQKTPEDIKMDEKHNKLYQKYKSQLDEIQQLKEALEYFKCESEHTKHIISNSKINAEIVEWIKNKIRKFPDGFFCDECGFSKNEHQSILENKP